MRSRVALVCIAALAAVHTVLLAPGAHAAAYRYWTYWQGTSGEWVFATAGPAFTLPADGAVEGWRFAVTTQSGTASAKPTRDADFNAICSETPAQPDLKRVALVVDFGIPQDAPTSESAPSAIATCVSIKQEASGYDVLRSVVEVRTDDGLICGLAGYPALECAPIVEDKGAAAPSAQVSSAPKPDDLTTQAALAPSTANGPLATIAVVAAIAVITSAIWWRRRKRG